MLAKPLLWFSQDDSDPFVYIGHLLIATSRTILQTSPYILAKLVNLIAEPGPPSLNTPALTLLDYL